MRKQRVPQLKHTETRGIGWHVSFRDPETGMPRKQRFGRVSKKDAEVAYHKWVADFLDGVITEAPKRQRQAEPKSATNSSVDVVAGSLLHVASSLLHFEQSRTRTAGEPRRQGTIDIHLYQARVRYSSEFLAFLNVRHGPGAVRSMRVADLSMEDVEAYNISLTENNLSASQVRKRLLFVRNLVQRAGRPEHGGQVLAWNWDSRDIHFGKPAANRTIPTLPQLRHVLKLCGVREKAIIWLAIGCGFGQRDLAALRVGQINRKSYDLRRGKTGIERFGDTPPTTWASVNAYLNIDKRDKGDLMFVTRKSYPLVHETTDSVAQWWTRLRDRLGKAGEGMDGFYSLRHLGATEYGSRPGTSIGQMKRWLGHSASSAIADVYMKPVSPESRPVIEWVRRTLADECRDFDA